MVDIHSRFVLDIHVHQSLIYLIFIWIRLMPRRVSHCSHMLLHSKSPTSLIRLNEDKIIIKLQPERVEKISVQRKEVSGKVIFEQVHRRVEVINKEKYIEGTFFSKLFKLRGNT